MTSIAKIWGTTEPLIVTPMFEMHRLKIEQWARCSFHVHRFKHNALYVVVGELFLDIANGDFEPPAEVRLRTGEHYTINPGVHHQFRTGHEPAHALEMYFTEPLSEDIVRRNIGERLKHD